MDIVVCGYNTFNKFELNSNNVTTNFCNKNSECKVFRSPVPLLSSPIDATSENISVFFTWSRCIITFQKKDDEICTTQICGFSANKSNCESLILNKTSCIAVTDGNVLLKENGCLNKLSLLHDGESELLSVLVTCDENFTTPVNLQHVSGGHRNIFSVYDNLNFGSIKLSDCVKSSASNSKSSSNETDVTVRISHIDFLNPIKEVSCGKEHVLFLSTSGNVYSYGLSSRGQLGHGCVENESSPRLIDALDGLAVKTVVAGGWHSTAVSEIGDLYVWGWNESGQLGLRSIRGGDNAGNEKFDDDVGIIAVPEYLVMPENVIEVACGSRHTVVLTETGRVFACGWNKYGQLGLGDTRNRDVMTEVEGLKACRIFAGHWNSAFIRPHVTPPSSS